MNMRTMSAVAAIAGTLIGCSSADGQSAAGQPGALRARSLAGADLGYAYALEPAWQFTLSGGATTTLVQMVLVKEQPSGAASPVLLWRALLSGSPLACSRFYEAADCTGPALIVPGVSGAGCVSGGRMYRPNFASAPAATTFASTEAPRWDPATLSFVRECVNVSGTTPPSTLLAVDAGPVAASPGRIYVEAAD